MFNYDEIKVDDDGDLVIGQKHDFGFAFWRAEDFIQIECWAGDGGYAAMLDSDGARQVAAWFNAAADKIEGDDGD